MHSDKERTPACECGEKMGIYLLAGIPALWAHQTDFYFQKTRVNGSIRHSGSSNNFLSSQMGLVCTGKRDKKTGSISYNHNYRKINKIKRVLTKYFA